MTENHEGMLPARSRKPVDDEAKAARAQEPAIAVDKLRDLQAAIEAAADTEVT